MSWVQDRHCTFLSKCLSKRVSASVSPPGHTAEDKPSVSKPTGKERKENHHDYCYYHETKIICIRSTQAYIGVHRPTQDCTSLHRSTQDYRGLHRSTQNCIGLLRRSTQDCLDLYMKAYTGLTRCETPAQRPQYSQDNKPLPQHLSSECTSSQGQQVTCYRIYKIFRF